jgi:predicted PurR-regulated permease PerM
MKAERFLLLAFGIALGFGCFLVLLPFLPAMLWAAIIVYCLWPLYARLARAVPKTIAAFLITAIIAALILVPLVHIAFMAAAEARHSRGFVQNVMQNGLPPAPGFLQHIPVAGGLIADFWNNSADDLGGAATINLTHGLVGIVVALFVSFFFFLSGEHIVHRLRQLLVPIMNESRVDHLLTLVAGTVRGVVFGIVGTAFLQGVLYAIGFEVARAPEALLFATLAGFISIVPAGAIIIYVPLCLFLLGSGHMWPAILLAAYCFIVVGGADSIVRPWLISRGAALPYGVTLIGVLGGAITFGALGIFLGPVLLALGLAAAEDFSGQPRGSWRLPPMP